jgi:hypothetical protein
MNYLLQRAIAALALAICCIYGVSSISTDTIISQAPTLAVGAIVVGGVETCFILLSIKSLDRRILKQFGYTAAGLIIIGITLILNVHTLARGEPEGVDTLILYINVDTVDTLNRFYLVYIGVYIPVGIVDTFYIYRENKRARE